MMTLENKPLLYDLWAKACSTSTAENSTQKNHQNNKSSGNSENSEGSKNSWEQNIRMLYQLGIGMEETIRFLYLNKPSYTEFEDWLNSKRSDTSHAVSNEVCSGLMYTDTSIGGIIT